MLGIFPDYFLLLSFFKRDNCKKNVMFDFRLKVFYTAALRLSFTKAAEELYISQPAVSRHIQEIESFYKVKLFHRVGSRIILTSAGKILLHYTTELFALYRNLDFEMNQLKEQMKGHLCLGASTTIAQYVLPTLMASFHDRFPEVSLELEIGNTEKIEELLLHKKIDLGLTEGRPHSNTLAYHPFLADRLVLVCRKGHPLAVNRSIPLSELLRLPVLLREKGSGTLDVITDGLKDHGLLLSELNCEMRIASTESIKNYLLESDSMAFLSLYCIRNQKESFAFMDVQTLNLERSFYFALTLGDTAGLPHQFMQYAFHYNFKL